MRQKRWKKLTEAVLDLFYPRRCPFCDRVIQPDASVCEDCRKKIPYVREPVCKKCGKPLADERTEYCMDCNRGRHIFTAGRAVFSYEGMVRESLYRFKYANRREYAMFYAGEAAAAYGGWIAHMGVQAIVPIPLHKKRKQKRGYNQAEVFAEALSKRLNIPVQSGILRRMINTRPQKALGNFERKKNMKNAFISAENMVHLDRILLVDDIYTTGTTVDAAAAALRDAGVKEIYVLCVSIGGDA